MLRVKSFKITDDIGINKLLDETRLAAGAHILVSEGYVCIPYEDGQPDTPAQQAVAIKEQRNTVVRELNTVQHSQKVNRLQIADALEQLKFATSAWEKARSNKALEEKKRKAQARVDELNNLFLMNDTESVRLQRNIAMFDEQLDVLQLR